MAEAVAAGPDMDCRDGSGREFTDGGGVGWCADELVVDDELLDARLLEAGKLRSIPATTDDEGGVAAGCDNRWCPCSSDG